MSLKFYPFSISCYGDMHTSYLIKVENEYIRGIVYKKLRIIIIGLVGNFLDVIVMCHIFGALFYKESII